jgi:tetratricopeptide (TPR) repeat protein
LSALILTGCSASRQAETTETPRTPTIADEARRERALSHFIEGSALDAKNMHGEAILEFQEALRYEPANPAIHDAIARSFIELNKFPRAAESAREAVRLEPANTSYRETLARVYAGSFQSDAAIAEYEAITQLDSTNNRVWYQLARLLQPKKPLRALQIYEMLMDRDGESWELLLQSAELYGTLGQYDRAADRYRSMLLIDPSNRALQRQLAETTIKAGRTDEALQLLEEIHDRHPDDSEVALVLGDLYFDRREPAKAVRILEQVRTMPSMHYEVKVRIGVTYFSQSENDSAMSLLARRVFEELRANQPADWRPHWYLGALALNARIDTVALASFAEVTRLEPRNADAWWFLGSLYMDRGDLTRALQTADRARQSVPNDFRVYLLKGLVFSRLEQPTQAVEELTQAYKLNSKDLNILSTLALTLDNLKRHEESDRLYEEALNVDSTNALILNNYAYSLSERGLHLQRAKRMSEMSLLAEPNNPSYLDTYGWILYMLGEYEEAREYIEKAVASGEASAVVLEHLGDVYDRLGMKDEAVVQWKKALEQSPTNEALKAKVERGTR